MTEPFKVKGKLQRADPISRNRPYDSKQLQREWLVELEKWIEREEMVDEMVEKVMSCEKSSSRES